ncbi:hypothetical protein [Micromonospora sp. NPDC003776]
MLIFSLSESLLLLGIWLLAVQPAAIPVGYATVRRHRRSGGSHPILTALGGWLTGCLLGAFTSGFIVGLGVGSEVVLLLFSYPPVWLLAWLFYRTGTATGPTASRGVESTPPKMDGR